MRSDKHKTGRLGAKTKQNKARPGCQLPTQKPRSFLAAQRRFATAVSYSLLPTIAAIAIMHALHFGTSNTQPNVIMRLTRFDPNASCLTNRSAMLMLAQLTSPLSWWFLSGCTGRGLETRLGLLLTLLALTEFIWGVVNLEEMSKPSQQKRRLETHHLCLFLQHCTICHLPPRLLEIVSRCVIPVPPHWCYVLPRSTEAGGAIADRHSPSGLGHITWEDLCLHGGLLITDCFYFSRSTSQASIMGLSAAVCVSPIQTLELRSGVLLKGTGHTHTYIYMYMYV